MTLAYKAATSGDNRVLITLEIPEDALTNLGRKSVLRPETASYRASKAKVLSIEDATGTSYDSATSAYCHPRTPLIYKKGDVVETEFDKNLEQVYAQGIHFFLDRGVANTFRLVPRDGKEHEWHENGVKKLERYRVNGELSHVSMCWYESGQLKEKAIYEGSLMTSYEEWYPHDQLRFSRKTTGENTQVETDWWPSGGKRREITTRIIQGKYGGKFKENYGVEQIWNEAGLLVRRQMWDKGMLNGLAESWHNNGKPYQVIMYKNGRTVTSKTWNELGVLTEEYEAWSCSIV
jgi:antitoxin component YwqK of YwqJK toxin-antitoxin module